ncbi:hypothetical protein SD70_25470 [Gordoniibacillus kamchatkensis]|uniref:MPN domain-containing protein n=1 Tax=Gordoniibacillus kamchatkensis TaxID=1590651 RepID=A0ABR5AC01_9BACL|nr:M67 family metallopeptidase [Paenibacillus sp. VKM B-2647]KIL38566.1 hypothetical protein SD70_25470 [Paenibacillus sp. VKM B-2647]
MPVTMCRELRQRLSDYCLSVYPLEACGFVTGDYIRETDELIADDFIPIRNDSGSPERHFEMNRSELAKLLASQPYQRLLGIFHSHPRTAPIPSAADLQTSWYSLPSYWIVSLQDADHPTLAVYRLARQSDGTLAPKLLPVRPPDGGAGLGA